MIVVYLLFFVTIIVSIITNSKCLMIACFLLFVGIAIWVGIYETVIIPKQEGKWREKHQEEMRKLDEEANRMFLTMFNFD